MRRHLLWFVSGALALVIAAGLGGLIFLRMASNGFSARAEPSFLEQLAAPVAVTALIIGSVLAFAHNGIEHILGTVTATTNDSITVETVKHTKVTGMVDSATTYAHQNMRMALGDLKTGERGAIDARERADKLVTVSVKWGPAPASGHDDHSK